MSFFVVDDQAPVHPKHSGLVERGLDGDPLALAAGYLWALMGAHLRASYTDGVVTVRDLYRVMPGPLVEALPPYLVEAGLWHDAESCCERCEPPRPGTWRYHDWAQWSQRTGDEDRARRALQAERKDASLHDAMWARDRLDPEDLPERALCAYCQRVVWRDTRKGDLSPEMDHVFGRSLGLDGVAVACRQCNRRKGNRSASRAGMNFHPTPPHAAALARRQEDGSRPDQGPADLLEAAWSAAPGGGPVPGTDSRSHPGWLEDPVGAGSVEASPPSGGGSGTPADGQERVQETAGGPAGTPVDNQAYRGLDGPQDARGSAREGNARPRPQQSPAALARPVADAASPSEPSSRAPARVRAYARTGPCAPVRAGERALSRPAGQGRAGQGQEEERQDGPEERKRRRRHRGRRRRRSSEGPAGAVRRRHEDD